MKPTKTVLIAVIIAFATASGVARADTPLATGDNLDGASCTACGAGVTRTSEGGAFTPAGWSQNAVDTRVIYDLGRGVACGKITFEATGWDPNQNMVGVSDADNYHDVFGVFEGIHGDPDTAVKNGETHIDIQVVAAPDRVCTEYHCRSIKLNAYAVTLSWSGGGCPECFLGGPAWCRPCGGWGYAQSDDVDWDTAKRYSFDIDWNYERAGLTVSEIGANPVVRQTSVAWLDSNPMRYFFLGGDRKGIDKEITGPVYTNVWITETSPCVDPCAGHCANGVQDCVEETVDNGGKCPPDAGASDGGVQTDAGVQDSGPGKDAGHDDTGSPDAGKHDAGIADSGIKTDASKGQDAEAGTDSGTGSDTGWSLADTGKADAAGATPGEETAGCGCATLSVE